ncbi:ketosteroid isomerase-like protein [Actinomycetospora succinea]|uniref:Ketosteroid isomerase-like protein n=1 Tax=Actinomycetospora succinea TaxID=663603 RepID=A0A4R6V222_9PSEU|nr:nuclear transport factor 2 family protein [Actinomycetospora succinea]TDQ50124.1 ketosteroid isomerase-like protein [Actinomycetospora succinea]
MTDLIELTTRTWNDRDRTGYRDCYAEDAELVVPGLAGKGHEVLLDFWDENMAAFPDNHITVHRAVARDDVLVEESRLDATNTGPLAGPDGSPIPATGRSVSIPFAGIHVVRDGRITSSHFYWDTYDMLGQLGLLEH